MSAETIFFSYSRDDSEFVLNLAKNLRKAGANIWLDQLDIKPGTRWDKSIESALASSNTLLVILSKSSVDSTNVMDEVSFALEEKKIVVPVLLEECDIPFRLRRLQFADFSTDQSKGIETLAAALNLEYNVASKLSNVATEKSHVSKEEVIEGQKIKEVVEAHKEELKAETKEAPKAKVEPVKPKAETSKSPSTGNKTSKSKLPIFIVLGVVAVAAILFMFKDSIFKDPDQIAWDLAKKGNRIGDYQEYLTEFPAGKYNAEAKDSSKVIQYRIDKKLDDSSWANAQKENTIEALQNYVNLEIPVHLNVEAAEQKILELSTAAGEQLADDNAWNAAVSGNSLASYLKYYKNKDVRGIHKSEVLPKLKEIGRTGWLYIARTNGQKITSDQLFTITWRPEEGDIPEDAMPKPGDLVKPRFTENSRRTYKNSSPRNSDNGSWKKNDEAYVLNTYIEGTNALILQVIYPK